MTRSLEQVLADLEQGDPKAFARAVFLNGLRVALQSARGPVSLPEISDLMGREESEVSAIESGLTNLTPFGLILDYLESCGASVRLDVTSASGDVISSLDTRQVRTQV